VVLERVGSKDTATNKAPRDGEILLISNKYKPIAMTQVSDMNGDGVSDLGIQVLEFATDKWSTWIVDPVSGEVIEKISF